MGVIVSGRSHCEWEEPLLLICAKFSFVTVITTPNYQY